MNCPAETTELGRWGGTDPDFWIGTLEEDAIHLWILSSSTATPSELDALAGTLSVVEQERAQRFKVIRDRSNFVAGRYLLRCILGKHCTLPPGDVPLEIETNGRPRVRRGADQQDIRFSVAHSGSTVVLGLCRGRNIGVDIEQPSLLTDFPLLSAKVLSESERRWVGSPVNPLRFYQLWTMKEALLKADGRGFLIDPQDIQIDVEPSRRFPGISGCLGSAWWGDWRIFERACIAIALEGPPPGLLKTASLAGGVNRPPEIICETYGWSDFNRTRRR